MRRKVILGIGFLGLVFPAFIVASTAAAPLPQSLSDMRWSSEPRIVARQQPPAAADRHSTTIQMDSDDFVIWRLDPFVILDDGISSARLEVEVFVATTSVELVFGPSGLSVDGLANCAGYPISVELYDDGTHGDSQANDHVYTIENITYWGGCASPSTYSVWTYDNLPGMWQYYLGRLRVLDSSGTEWLSDMNYSPALFVMDDQIPIDPVQTIDESVQMTAHVINLRDDSSFIARYLIWAAEPFDEVITSLGKQIYHWFPDEFEFLIFTSAEVGLFGAYQLGGYHNHVQVNYTGTGYELNDNSDLFGSRGTLLAVNYLNVRQFLNWHHIFTHEIMHQWGAALDESLGLRSGAHWLSNNSIKGILGGGGWQDNGDGTFTCLPSFEPPTGPLELYLMGLAWPDEVGSLYIKENLESCPPQTVITGPFTIVTIDDIIAVEGARVPGPSNSPKLYRMAFVVTSNGRLLTPVEMTFFGRIASTYASPIAAEGSRVFYPFSQMVDFRAALKTELPDPFLYRQYIPIVMKGP